MNRICYCKHCGNGEKEIFMKHHSGSEEYDGLADFHFVSKQDPRWESYEWSTFNFLMDPTHHISRVLEKKKAELGEIPPDLEVHNCDGTDAYAVECKYGV